jgi:hypothetical protein
LEKKVYNVSKEEVKAINCKSKGHEYADIPKNPPKSRAFFRYSLNKVIEFFGLKHSE